MKTKNKELELLKELLVLYDKYGRESFDSLSNLIQSPAIKSIQEMSWLLGHPQGVVFNAPDHLSNEMVSMPALRSGNVEAVVKLLQKESKSIKKTFIDELTTSFCSGWKSKTKAEGISRLIECAKGLSTDDAMNLERKIKEYLYGEDRSLKGWSDIILHRE